MGDHAGGDRFHVLCVCTGNVYRSRLTADVLRARLAGISAEIDVASAGTRADAGARVTAEQEAACLRHGHRLDPAPLRLLDRNAVIAADLILCAEVAHRRAVLEMEPRAMRRTFLTMELARVAPAAASRVPRTATGAATRARALVSAAAQLRGTVPVVGDESIPDPWGQPDTVLASAVRRIEDAVDQIVRALAP